MKSFSLKIVLCGVLVVLVLSQTGQLTSAANSASEVEPNSIQAQYQQDPPLRYSEPVETVVADLEVYIPERMRDADVPGLAIALIRDGEVIWTEGFGVTNRITGELVTSDTVFEVASISKVVAAYTAFSLVEEEKLSLDEPIITNLSKPWLPPSEYGDKITLRHLASHSSGLTDNLLPLDKSIAFEPGSDFLYSGVGALYIQEAIEQTTGKSLEGAARQIVFEPLGMSSSSYVNMADTLPYKANGHIVYKIPLLFFLILFIPTFFIFSLVAVLILRIKKGRWQPPRKMVVGISALVALLTFLILIFLLVKALPNFLLQIALCTAGFTVAFLVTFFIGGKIKAYLPSQWYVGKFKFGLTIAWIVLSFIVLFWLSGLITVPLPNALSPQPYAVGTLQTTAPDLALFLIELEDPQYLSKDMAEQIRTPQVSISDDFSWGLGPGIQHSKHGDALWQNGQTLGFRSVMVIYPDQGIGVVVLTNSDNGFPLVYDVAQRALGGKSHWNFF